MSLSFLSRWTDSFEPTSHGRGFTRSRTAKRSELRRRPGFEQLEFRRLLAVITFQDANGGSWHDATKWDLQRVPTAGDDVVIPAFVGNPEITYSTGTLELKSLTSSETLRMTGGELAATLMHQLDRSFILDGGTLRDTTLTTGQMLVPSTGSQLGDLTIGTNATLTVGANARTSLITNHTVTIDGSAIFEAGSRTTLQNRSSALGPLHLTRILVNGTLTANGATFDRGPSNSPTTIEVGTGGRLVATDSVFANDELSWEFGAVINATDLRNNRFDAELLIPPNLVGRLSAANGGSDNQRFGLIKLRGGQFTSGQLVLGRIGTQTTEGLSYLFTDNLQIGSGASLTVQPNVQAAIATNRTLTIDGSAAFQAGSRTTLQNRSSALGPLHLTRILVNGTLTANGATFDRGPSNSPTTIEVGTGGRLVATDSVFANDELSWDFGAVINATDLRNNRFDAELLIPPNLVGRLSAANGGSDNQRFGLIKLRGGQFTSGQLVLGRIGTQTTEGLSYLFTDNLQIGSGASLTIQPNVQAAIATNRTLTIDGSAAFQAGSRTTLQNRSSALGPLHLTRILVNGTLTANGATFDRGPSNSPTTIEVGTGGRLVATDSVFANDELSWDFGAVINATDLRNNRFDAELLIPPNLVGRLSAANGGSNNQRFGLIKLRGGQFTSGQLVLGRIGTQTTEGLSYLFTDNLQIGSGASLTVQPNVQAAIATNRTLTIDGTAAFQAGSRTTFQNRSSALGPLHLTQILVNGTLTATGAVFERGTSNSPARIVVAPNGTFVSENSSYPLIEQQHGLNSSILFSLNEQSVSEIGTGGLATSLNEFDSLVVMEGSVLTVDQSVRVSSGAIFQVASSSIYSTTGSLLVEPSSATSFVPSGNFRFIGAGTAANPQLLEVVSSDLGLTREGFDPSNYLFGSIEVGPDTVVRLTDQYDNSPGGAEAIYTNGLIVRAGSTLDLAGLKLYTRSILIETGGRVINGSVEPVFPDGGPLVLGQPTPGRIAIPGEVDLWTFFARAGGSVSIQLNPGNLAQPAPVAPQLNLGRVELVAPDGQSLAVALSSAAGELASIASLELPAEGVYTLRVGAPASAAIATGNYVITAWDTTPNVRDTRIIMTSNRATMSYGQSVVFTTTVKPLVANGPEATGTVQFQIDGVDVGSPVPLSASTHSADLSLPILGGGQRQITVVYSGDGDHYDPKISDPFIQDVGLARLTVTADNKSKVAGQPLPEFTYVIDGFVNGEDSSVLVGQPILSTSNPAINRIGNYLIDVGMGTLESPNYDFSLRGATLVVTAAEPAAIEINGGSPQSTKAGRLFPQTMSLRVRDAFDNAVSGALVTLSAPTTGASGVFENNDRSIIVSTDGFGRVFINRFLSNEEEGSFEVVAMHVGVSGVFQLTNLPQGAPLELALASDSIDERSGVTVATLRRNTPLGQPMTVVLTSDDPQRISIPSSIQFGDDDDVVQFEVTAINNLLAEGNRLITINAQSLTASATATVWVLDDEEPMLNLLFSPLSIPENGGVATATITRNTPNMDEMIVTLTSPYRAYIEFPLAVTIPAGLNSTTFQIFAIDDNQATGTRVVEMTASSTGLLPSTRTLELFDDDVPELQLLFSAERIDEDAGLVMVTLGRNTPVDEDLVVELSSLPTGILLPPPAITIPRGVEIIEFAIQVVENPLATGDIDVTLTATAEGFTTGVARVTIVDQDTAELAMSASDLTVQEGGPAIEVTIARNTPITDALVISLSADQADQLEFPEQVTIPAGQTSVTFEVSAIANSIADGDRVVQISATAAGFAGGTVSLTILDVELLHPWTNPNNPLDVNNDGRVTPIDALIVVSYLNEFGSGLLPLPWDGLFIDTNRDGRISPFDALLIVSELNEQSLGEGEANRLSGEGGYADERVRSSIPANQRRYSPRAQYDLVTVEKERKKRAEQYDAYFALYDGLNEDDEIAL
jgi:hypothetical protein